MGLLDPDSFTQKFDTAVQKGTAHRVMGSLIGFQLNDGNQAFYSAGEHLKGYRPIPPPAGTAAYWGGYVQPLGVDGHIAISAATKYPERAMELVNFFFSEEGSRLAWSGAEGSTYDNVDGRLTVKPEIIEQRNSDPDFAIRTGVGRYGSFAGLPPSHKDANGQYLNLFQEPDVLALDDTPMDRAYFEHYGVESYEELINERVETALVDTSVILLTDQTPDDIKRIDDKIINYLTTNGPRLILAESDEEFAQIQAEMISAVKAMDFDISFAYWSRVAEEAKAAMAEMSQ
jgi:ABC-type glycerol-3-phosphate transport system substrate-binding protein